MEKITSDVFDFFDINWGHVQNYFISLILTGVITYFVLRMIRMSIHQFFKRTDLIEEKKENTIESVVRNTSNYVLFTLVLIAAIKPFVINLKEFIMAGGIIAAIVGFGAQKLINDLLSGIFIIFERTVQKGDFVHINGEIEGGTVEELGFRVIKIRLINGKLVTISNGEIRKLVNGSVEMRRVFESVIVSFNENPEKVKVVLQEVCEELNERHKPYLLVDKMVGEFKEEYRVYGLHSLDVSPLGYKFSITATVKDTDYITAAQEAKQLLAQTLYDHKIVLPAQQVVLQREPQSSAIK
ncbi:mechanosensitive ion channel family protein [Bacillus sp. 1NLA3E]|uniref:mechanosensitive ion channel family protein n=1 Tax=Bacillus sp. 1NLA3E TaxID=666686 RepID=UPI000247EAC1|nr:mechanosensitive ion channel family protein [Bacillus sp. 1NLA3E]AGK53392.1 mechanosensitive ion channel [Bacillus sp. 1NLA3E]